MYVEDVSDDAVQRDASIHFDVEEEDVSTVIGIDRNAPSPTSVHQRDTVMYPIYQASSAIDVGMVDLPLATPGDVDFICNLIDRFEEATQSVEQRPVPKKRRLEKPQQDEAPPPPLPCFDTIQEVRRSILELRERPAGLHNRPPVQSSAKKVKQQPPKTFLDAAGLNFLKEIPGGEENKKMEVLPVAPSHRYQKEQSLEDIHGVATHRHRLRRVRREAAIFPTPTVPDNVAMSKEARRKQLL